MPRVFLVLGAGPAGSLAACLLARGGASVTLVEQHPFPRDKVCGECLSALGCDVLRRAGLLSKLTDFGPARLTQSVLYAPGGGRAAVSLPRPMLGLSRARMDQALLDAARAAGAQILQPATCLSLEPGRATVRIATDALPVHLQADCLLVATGRPVTPLPPAMPNGDFGLKAHFRGVAAPTDSIGLYGLDGHYVGVAPIEDGLWNVASAISGAKLRESARKLDELFQNLLGENRSLGSQFKNATRASPWLVSPLPRDLPKPHWPAGIIPVGNAAAALEPIGGEGMGLALRSAELTAETLLSDVPNLARLHRSFDLLWRVRSRACRAAARLISRPSLSNAALWSLAGSELITAPALALLGKV